MWGGGGGEVVVAHALNSKELIREPYAHDIQYVYLGRLYISMQNVTASITREASWADWLKSGESRMCKIIRGGGGVIHILAEKRCFSFTL